MSKPKYNSELLTLGNPESQVGIITLFTQKDRVLSFLSPDDFYVVGQLYNPSQGISILIRNCLANKNIRYLIVCGLDLSQSGEALVQLKKEGVQPIIENSELQGYLIKGVKEKRFIEKELPLEAINTFRKNVEVLDYRSLRDLTELKKIIKQLPKLPSYGQPEYFPEAEIQVERFPSDSSVFKVRGKFVGETWLKILDTVLRFGVIKKSEYSERQKEVLNLVAVITDENPKEVKWEDYFQFSREHLENYLPLVVSNKEVKGVNYTYGTRLRAWRGIDQIKSLVQKLKKSPDTRRAVAVTWDVEKDHDHEEAPCLDVVQCLVQENKLFMTAFIRSNDMFEAWPENAIALRSLQYSIAEELSLPVGSLTTISGSAHIYERNWKLAQDLLTKYPPVVERLNDPRGNIVIYLQEGLIMIEHQSPEGKVVEMMHGKTAAELYVELAKKQKVSDIYHAFYIGKELDRAELALKKGLTYSQERELNFSESIKNDNKDTTLSENRNNKEKKGSKDNKEKKGIDSLKKKNKKK